MPAERRPRVLVVEDNALNLLLVESALADSDYEVISTGSAEEALVELNGSRPDLVLMDIQLPGMDGLELTRRLRSEPRTRDLMIVALSAYAMDEDVARARAAGCDDYIAKPIDIRAFPGQVAALLERSKGVC
jgi:CheY-like chemotaxis protein